MNAIAESNTRKTGTQHSYMSTITLKMLPSDDNPLKVIGRSMNRRN